MIKKHATSRKGRKCKFHGCKRTLSVYNHEITCRFHSAIITRGNHY